MYIVGQILQEMKAIYFNICAYAFHVASFVCARVSSGLVAAALMHMM